MLRVRRSAGRLARRLHVRAPRVAKQAPARPDATPAAPAIAWTYPEQGGSFDQRVELFRSLLGLFVPGRLLDLACGTGIFAIAAHELGWTVTAVDARTERMPMTPGITWQQQDVRDVDTSGYDVIALLGLLYHLEVADQLDLLRRCNRSVLILDTHHSLRPTHTERGYVGHTFRELPPQREAELATTPTAAWGNPTSFWATQPDLVRMIKDSGFETVLTVVPPNLPNRSFYLCLPAGWTRPGATTPTA